MRKDYGAWGYMVRDRARGEHSGINPAADPSQPDGLTSIWPYG